MAKTTAYGISGTARVLLATLLLCAALSAENASITATTKGPNQINLTWPPSANPGYGYLVEIQSDSDSRYADWTEWRPVPTALGYTCDPSVIVNGSSCNISDPQGIHIYRPATNGVPFWVTDTSYMDPQDGTPAQLITYGLMPDTLYNFRVRTYIGNSTPDYGGYSDVATARTSAYDLRYVSPTGADTNDGTSPDDAHAWGTLSQASTLVCGQALIVLAGTYGSDYVALEQECSAAKKIVVMADPGSSVTTAATWGVSGQSIVVDGLTMRTTLYGDDYTVVISGTNSALLGVDVGPVVIPATTHNGVQIRGGYSNLIYGAYIHDFGSPDETQNPSGNGGFPLNVVGAQNNVIWSNHLTRGGHDTSFCQDAGGNRWQNNIMDGGWGMGFEALYGGSVNNLIEGNIIFDSARLVTAYKPGIEISQGPNTVRRNTIVNAVPCAIEVSALYSGSVVTGTLIYNNVFYNTGSCYFQSHNEGTAAYDGVVWSNNICYKMGNWNAAVEMYLGNLTNKVQNNAILAVDVNGNAQPNQPNIQWYQDAGGDTFSYPQTVAFADTNYPPFTNNAQFSVDPQFVDEANGDFHLTAGSPLRGMGTQIFDPVWGFPYANVTDIGIGSATGVLSIYLQR